MDRGRSGADGLSRASKQPDRHKIGDGSLGFVAHLKGQRANADRVGVLVEDQSEDRTPRLRQTSTLHGKYPFLCQAGGC